MRLAAVLLFTLLASPAVRAGSVSASEGFDYPPGISLNALNGGSGWSSPWSTPGGLDLTTSGGLTFGDLAVSGGAASSAGSQPPNQGSSVAFWFRDLSTTLGADNTTVFLSFLLRPDAGFGFYGGLNFGNVFIGRSGNQSFYGLEGPTNDISLSTVPVVQDQTVLLVLQADFLPGNDRLSLFVDPTPGQPEPATADVLKTDLDVGSVGNLVINNYGGYTVDEIRIGSSFDAVTPVPEPRGSLVLAFAGLLMLAVRAGVTASR
jgi:hypothetical protein